MAAQAQDLTELLITELKLYSEKNKLCWVINYEMTLTVVAHSFSEEDSNFIFKIKNKYGRKTVFLNDNNGNVRLLISQ